MRRPFRWKTSLEIPFFFENLPKHAEALNTKICRLIGFQSTKELENTDEGALRVAIQQLQFSIPAAAATASGQSCEMSQIWQIYICTFSPNSKF